MGTTAWIMIIASAAVLLPSAIGWVAGVRVAPGNSYRQTPVVAWICTLAIAFVVLIVADATTPQSECGGTGCDTGNGVGAAFIALITYGPVLIGTILGRRHARRRHQSTEP
jgi:hypothetical protein